MRSTAVAVSALALIATASTPLVASASTSPSRCRLGDLSVHLGAAGHAAGSTYRTIVFTNTGDAACTLRGYPGVAYVAPTSGRQIGAAASRDDAVRTRTVPLARGAHAASLLRLVTAFNYPAADCSARSVSGLRVYPPGSTTAAYVAFAHHHKACSSKVHQLAVRVVLHGTTGE